MSSQPNQNRQDPRPTPELLQSLALWGERPWEAPEVPPPVILRAWAEDRLVHPGLDVQIAESINCERTLPLLDLLAEPGESDPADAVPALPALAGEHERHDPPPRPGQLWTTRGAVEHFGDGLPGIRWTFDQVPVLLVAGPVEFEDGERVWRAVAASPAGNWPEWVRGPEDCEVAAGSAGDFVAHLWLEYPVSESQLFKCFGQVSADTLSQLHYLGAGRPEGDPLEFESAGEMAEEIPVTQEEEEVHLARNRLLARCAFLPMTADARREMREWFAQQWDQLGLQAVAAPSPTKGLGRRVPLFNSPGTSKEWQSAAQDNFQALAARGAGQSRRCQAILYHGEPGDLRREQVEKHLAGEPPQEVDILDEPTSESAFSGATFASWDTATLLPPPHPMRFFAALSPDLGQILAAGAVSDGVARATSCDWDAVKPLMSDWNRWVLVIFVPPDLPSGS